MKVLHISAECYPVAKTGGLGDVVGALPKYQQKLGYDAAVVMPWYDKKFMAENEFDEVFRSEFKQGSQYYPFVVLKERNDILGFQLFVIKVPGLLDRPDVYGYADESNQFIGFQHAVLCWLCQNEIKPAVVHCHDHHSGLIPFFIEYSEDFKALKGTPTLATIHNGEYQGWMDWHKAIIMPSFDSEKWGLLDWNNCINPLAALVKCCWAYNAVSSGYLSELFEEANGLESLFLAERSKGYGILNGIDSDVWNPETDFYLTHGFKVNTVVSGKSKNKKALCKDYALDPKKPLLAFIGRFAIEKGADLLPYLAQELGSRYKGRLNFLILGSGDPQIEDALKKLREVHRENLAVEIGYNEALSHKIYASADFLLMPSRVEPCGLNQLYAMKYGTVPVVRKIGGLSDTVIDLTDKNPSGIVFNQATVSEILQAVERALTLADDTKQFNALRKKIMKLDYSWTSSTLQYIQLYEKLIHRL